MNKLPSAKRAEIVQLLVEGNSLRSTARITDTSLTTVIKLLVDVGKACLKFHSKTVVQIRSKRVQCDELWSFIQCKQMNNKENKPGIGDIWTWVAIDADTKLVISWYVGQRDLYAAKFFMNDLWCRLRTRVQLSTDGYSAYTEAVADSFGGKVDFGQIIKYYKNRTDEEKYERWGRYLGAKRKVISGNPDKKHISTCFVERQNLTMRMCIRRYTREVNAFSKKYENHCYAVALNFVYYNFVRIHKTLRVTPAMEAGLTKKPLTFENIANLI